MVTVCDFLEILNVYISIRPLLLIQTQYYDPERSIDPILISDFHQFIPRRGNYCVVLYSAVYRISTQVHENFIRMKVAWKKNKREFKRLHFPLSCVSRVVN